MGEAVTCDLCKQSSGRSPLVADGIAICRTCAILVVRDWQRRNCVGPKLPRLTTTRKSAVRSAMARAGFGCTAAGS